MTHRHVNDPKTCVEVGENVCLTRTTDGYFIHFDPPEDGTRQVGAFSCGPGGWTCTGTLEGGDLTVRPSIRVSMPVDGKNVELLHGFVTAGKWVPA